MTVLVHYNLTIESFHPFTSTTVNSSNTPLELITGINSNYNLSLNYILCSKEVHKHIPLGKLAIYYVFTIL